MGPRLDGNLKPRTETIRLGEAPIRSLAGDWVTAVHVNPTEIISASVHRILVVQTNGDEIHDTFVTGLSRGTGADDGGLAISGASCESGGRGKPRREPQER